MRMSCKQNPLIGTGKVARLLGITRQTVLKWTREGVLPAPTYRHGHVVRWEAAEIEQWLKARRQQTEA